MRRARNSGINLDARRFTVKGLRFGLLNLSTMEQTSVCAFVVLCVLCGTGLNPQRLTEESHRVRMAKLLCSTIESSEMHLTLIPRLMKTIS